MRFRLEPIREISERTGQVMKITEETGVGEGETSRERADLIVEGCVADA
jgi:hypothetical protein